MGSYAVGDVRALVPARKAGWSSPSEQKASGKTFFLLSFFGTRDLFNISYSRELYLFSKFLHFEEIVRVEMAVCFE